MKKLKFTLAFGLLAILLASCSKEEILLDTPKVYPDELTMDNWREFVDAPEEVLEKFNQAEKMQVVRSPQSNEGEMELNRMIHGPMLLGKVQVIGDGLNPATNFLGGTRVKITSGSQTNIAISTYSAQLGGNNWWVPNYPNGTVCMYHKGKQAGFSPQDWQEGLTAFDLLRIQQHINETPLFTELWQYLAADANGDGLINSTDINLLSALISGSINSLPSMYLETYSQPVIFFPQSLYPGISTNLLSIFPQWVDYLTCGQNDYTVDRYAIKRGDLNGSWSF